MQSPGEEGRWEMSDEFFSIDEEDEASGRLFLEGLLNRTETIDFDPTVTIDRNAVECDRTGDIQAAALAKLLDSLPLPSFTVDKSSKLLFANKACDRIGVDRNEVGSECLSGLLPKGPDSHSMMGLVRKIFEDRRPRTTEGIVGKKPSTMWGRMHLRPLRLAGRHSVLFLVEDLTHEKKEVALVKKYSRKLRTAHDKLEARVEERTSELLRANEKLRREIADRTKAEASLNLAANIIRSSNEAILITDASATIVDVNEAFCRVTGYSRDEVVGANPSMMSSGRHDRDFWEGFWQDLQNSGQWRGEVWDRRKNGEVFPKLLSVSAISNGRDEVTHFVGIFSDISKIKQTEQHLEKLAHYDPLTGLANRVLFRDRVDHAITVAKRTGEKLAVMFLDLDDFKIVNDTLGHPAGDELLAQVGKRLRTCVRQSDTVARLGGDEFTLLLVNFADTRSLDFLARKIIGRLAEPFTISERTLYVTTSIGISLFPDDSRDVDEMIRNSDTAMYNAKEKGKNRVEYFSKEMNARAVKRLDLETSLREALKEEQFVLYFQPQIDIASGRVSGCEALIRWNHPRHGVVSPAEFIGLAEETGLIIPIGEWALRMSCEQMRWWQQRGMPSFRMGVNVSGRQLWGAEIVRVISEILDTSGLDPSLLDIEVTESTLMHNTDESVKILYAIKSLGVSLSIDDFGTGYSSLSHLKLFPLDKLKIDQSFIRNVKTDADDEAIVRAIIAVGNHMRMKVLAEGVETAEQLEFLRTNGCHEVQGYYYSKPLTANSFSQFLEAHGS